MKCKRDDFDINGVKGILVSKHKNLCFQYVIVGIMTSAYEGFYIIPNMNIYKYMIV